MAEYKIKEIKKVLREAYEQLEESNHIEVILAGHGILNKNKEEWDEANKQTRMAMEFLRRAITDYEVLENSGRLADIERNKARKLQLKTRKLFVLISKKSEIFNDEGYSVDNVIMDHIALLSGMTPFVYSYIDESTGKTEKIEIKPDAVIKEIYNSERWEEDGDIQNAIESKARETFINWLNIYLGYFTGAIDETDPEGNIINYQKEGIGVMKALIEKCKTSTEIIKKDILKNKTTGKINIQQKIEKIEEINKKFKI